MLLAGLLLILFVRHVALGDAITRGHRDFLSFYAAAHMAWGGEAPAIWNAAAHAAAEVALLGAEMPYFQFFYPPHFLFACLPVAALPLVAGYAAWVLATGGLLVAALRGAGLGWLPVAVLMLSPAAFFTIATGQNAFLTTALMVGAATAMARRPGLAGLALAALSIKPQLGLMVVPALLGAGRGRVLAAACLAGLGMMAASAWAFGAASWAGFLGGGTGARAAMEGSLLTFKMQSVFALVMQWGGGPVLGYAAQAAAAMTALAALWPGLRRRPGPLWEVAAMASGGMLMTPFLQFYDLMLLTLPMLAIGLAPRRRPGEAAGLLVLLLGPALSWAVGDAFGFTLGPLLPALAVVMLRRQLQIQPAIPDAGRSLRI